MIKTDNAYFMFKITLQTHTNYIQIYRTLYYNPSVNFCGLSLVKNGHVTSRTMVIKGLSASRVNIRLILFRQKKNLETSKRLS